MKPRMKIMSSILLIVFSFNVLFSNAVQAGMELGSSSIAVTTALPYSMVSSEGFVEVLAGLDKSSSSYSEQLEPFYDLLENNQWQRSLGKLQDLESSGNIPEYDLDGAWLDFYKILHSEDKDEMLVWILKEMDNRAVGWTHPNMARRLDESWLAVPEYFYKEDKYTKLLPFYTTMDSRSIGWASDKSRKQLDAMWFKLPRYLYNGDREDLLPEAFRAGESREWVLEEGRDKWVALKEKRDFESDDYDINTEYINLFLWLEDLPTIAGTRQVISDIKGVLDVSSTSEDYMPGIYQKATASLRKLIDKYADWAWWDIFTPDICRWMLKKSNKKIRGIYLSAGLYRSNKISAVPLTIKILRFGLETFLTVDFLFVGGIVVLNETRFYIPLKYVIAGGVWLVTQYIDNKFFKLYIMGSRINYNGKTVATTRELEDNRVSSSLEKSQSVVVNDKVGGLSFSSDKVRIDSSTVYSNSYIKPGFSPVVYDITPLSLPEFLEIE